jgi:hypothetical protein
MYLTTERSKGARICGRCINTGLYITRWHTKPTHNVTSVNLLDDLHIHKIGNFRQYAHNHHKGSLSRSAVPTAAVHRYTKQSALNRRMIKRAVLHLCYNERGENPCRTFVKIAAARLPTSTKRLVKPTPLNVDLCGQVSSTELHVQLCTYIASRNTIRPMREYHTYTGKHISRACCRCTLPQSHHPRARRPRLFGTAEVARHRAGRTYPKIFDLGSAGRYGTCT